MLVVTELDVVAIVVELEVPVIVVELEGVAVIVELVLAVGVVQLVLVTVPPMTVVVGWELGVESCMFELDELPYTAPLELCMEPGVVQLDEVTAEPL